MTPAPPVREVVADVPCQECGYNLRGLRTDGRCPECGIGVWLSLSAPPRLANAHGPWVRSVRRGASILIAGYLTISAALVAGVSAHHGLLELASIVGILVGVGLIAAGSSSFGKAEAYTPDMAPLIRAVVQQSGWGVAIVLVLMLVARDPLPLLAALCVMVNQVSIIRYSGILARRIPVAWFRPFRAGLMVVLGCSWAGVPIVEGSRYRSAVPGLLVLTVVAVAACLGVLLAVMPKHGRPASEPWTQPAADPQSGKQ